MDEAPRIYPNLSDETQFKRDKINEIKDCFIDELREREAMSNRLSKYIAAFDYLQFFLSATSGGISIIYFATAIGFPVGITSTSFSLAFSLTAEIVK